MTFDRDVAVVSQFVLRARRVAAHSLAQNRDMLSTFAGFKLSGTVSLDGSMSMRRALPDEEVFESLAARIRPFTLKRETIYFDDVFQAVYRLLDLSDTAVEDEGKARLSQLQKAWARIDLQGKGFLAFYLQAERADGSQKTPLVSDIQLAASWMYADLVHSDPTGNKREGLSFPIKERYSAAVTVFSHLALLTFATHDAFMELHDSGALTLDPLSLNDDVVVGKNELFDEGVAYVGPSEDEMPFPESIIGGPPKGWEQFTPTTLLRQTPQNQVEVVLSSLDGSVVASYDAAVSARWQEDDETHWTVLIAGAVTAEFSIAVQEQEQRLRWTFIGWKSKATTNKMQLAEILLQLQMIEADAVQFLASGTQFFSFPIPEMPEQRVAFLQVAAEVLTDLVVIEALSGSSLEPWDSKCTMIQRIHLRQTRLLMEGHLVPFAPPPMQVTFATGQIPSVISQKERVFTIGASTSVTFPAVTIRHPLMRVEEVKNDPADESLDILRMSTPGGEPFLSWIPKLLQVDEDKDLLHPVELAFVDQNQTALFGGWDGTISSAPTSDHDQQ